MRSLKFIAIIIVSACANTAFAEEETLQNDGFTSGAPVTFQGGFIAGETAAARFVPQIACPCVIDSVTMLFGGASVSQDVAINVWDDPTGGDAPGALLFTGDVTLTGSNIAFQEIDLSLTAIAVNGPFRVGVEFSHGGLPSVATDLDGTIDAGANFIQQDIAGFLFWFQSAALGVSGDFVLRATIDNLSASDLDSDGVADSIDNCTLIANTGQEDTDVDGFGNACDSDFNNDCIVNPVDLGLFKLAFFSTPAAPNWNPNADQNSDGVVNAIDLGTVKSLFFEVPGPSGIPNVCD